MKHTILLKLLRIALSLCMIGGSSLALAEPDPNYHIYICWGQSNMEGNATVPDSEKQGIDERFRMFYTADNCSQCGKKKCGEYTAVPPLARCFHWNNGGFGPVDYFGRTLVKELDPSIRVGVIDVAIGGASIDAFRKTKYQSYLSSAASWLQDYAKSYGSNPYGRIIEVAKEAQKVGVIKGILVHQGETNTGDQSWPNNLKEVYQNMLDDLGLNGADVPLLVGEVRYSGPCSGHNNVVRKVPSVIPNSYVISAEGCEAANDEYHFTVAGYKLLGKRYAEKMLEILEKNGGANPQAGIKIETFINKESEPGEVEIIVNNEIENTKSIEIYADGNKLVSGETKYVWDNVSEGTHTIWAVAYDNDNKEYTTSKKEVTIFMPQAPFNGVPFKIPGKIEAEEFDNGGEGNAYHDNEEENRSEVKGNRKEGVDASPTAIGYTQTGEWLEYTVDIQYEDEYIVESKVASGVNGAAFTFYLDNSFIVPGDDGTPGGFVKVPNTGDWNTFEIVETKLNKLSKGTHVLKVEITGDWVDIDCFTFRCVNPTGAEPISAENGLIPDDEYNVYDIAGRFVKKITVSQNSYKNSLKSGFYILRNSKGKNYTLLVRK